MPAAAPSRQHRRHPAEAGARTAPAKRHTLAWVRDVLMRVLRLEQRRKVPAGSAEMPRHAAEPPTFLMQQRAELGARLLVHDPKTQIVRYLFAVHDCLGKGGWPAVEALPLKTIGRALGEAELLFSDEPTPMLATIVDRLRELKTAADRRAAIEALDREFEAPPLPEVMDSDFAEFELMERSWAGTVPAAL